MSPRFKTKLYQASSLLCLAGVAVPATAVAQSAPPPAASSARAPDTSSKGIEEIVVTAYKREEQSSKVGMTFQAIGDKALEEQHVTTLEDLANAVPGLTFTETENATPVYTLRGVGFYETSVAAYPDVSVYLDQAPLPLPAQTALTLFDIGRIEVLKGPQGTLFGNNATGGAINYIANKPTANFAAGSQVSYGRYNTGQIDGFVSGPLTHTLLGRIAVSVTEAGEGWQHSQTRHDTAGKPDKIAARALLDWHATDALRFQFNVNGWHDGSQPQQPQHIQFKPTFPSFSPLVNQPIGPNDATVADWPAKYRPRANDGLVQTSVRADYGVTDTIQITSITDYLHYSRDERPNADGSMFVANDVTENVGWAESYSQELRVAGGGAGPFRWVGGLNYSGDHVWERNTVSWPDGTPFTFRPFAGSAGNSDDSNQRMKNYAAFVHGEYDIDRVTLKAGVRGTEADRSDNSCGIYYRGTPQDPNGIIQNFVAASAAFLGHRAFTPVAPNQCTLVGPATGPTPYATGRFIQNLNEHNVSWSAGVDWKPTDTILGYANVSRGYKAGGFPTLPASYFAALEPVTQEKVTDYEAGIKSQFFGRRLLVDGAVFYYDYVNKQLKSRIIDPLFGVLTALVNVPKSSIRGAELEVHARPLVGLDIGAAATYLDARIDTFIGVNQIGKVANFAGSEVPYTPKWSLAGNIGYEHPISDRLSGFVGGQISYRSTITAAIGSPALYVMPSYSLVDLQVGVESQDGRWRAFLWGKNVFNRFYVNNIVAQEDNVIRYTGLPVTYGITGSYRF